MKNKQFFLLRLTFFIRYFGDAIFYSFLQVFLTYKGLSEGQIGLVASITPITGLICNPFWNQIAKDVNTNRKIMRIITIIEGILIICFIPFSKLELICVLICIIAIVGSPFYNLLDGYASTYAENNGKNYALIRIMGSTAYIFGTIVGGQLIERLSYQVAIAVGGSIFVFVFFLISALKPLKLNTNGNQNKRDFKAIFKNKKFIIYLLVFLFTIVISIQGDNFISLYMTKYCGLSTSTYGFVASGFIICEVITMLILSKFFAKTSESKLLIFAGIIYTLRSILLGFNLPLGVTIGVVMLRGIAWGTVLCVHIRYLIKIVGIANATAAIFIISIFQSIFTFIGSNVYGNIIENFGYKTAYLSIGIICGSTTLLFAIYKLFNKTKTPKGFYLNR